MTSSIYLAETFQKPPILNSAETKTSETLLVPKQWKVAKPKGNQQATYKVNVQYTQPTTEPCATNKSRKQQRFEVTISDLSQLKLQV